MSTLQPVAPLSLQEVVTLFRPAAFPWWVAGGWAIDLFLSTRTRTHADVDVLVLRRDQRSLRALLEGWDLYAADPPGAGSRRPWPAGEWLELPLHEVWCRSRPEGPWQLEIMLGESDDERWVFRRNPSITRPLESLGRTTDEGIPYIAPEVILLFKAKRPRPKDQQDFDALIDLLAPPEKEWLRKALTTTHGNHTWLERL